MADFENIDCGDQAENTGQGNCNPDFGLDTMIIFTPKGFVIPQASRATPAILLAFLQAAAANPIKSQRIYPVKTIQANEGAGTDAATEESGYGGTRNIRREKLGWTYTMWESICLNNALIKGFDRKPNSFDFMVMDDMSQLDGTVLSNGDMKGYALENLYIGSMRKPDGTVGSSFPITLNLKDSSEYDQRRLIVATGTGVTDLMGIETINTVNITPAITPAPAVGTYYVDVVTACGAQSLVPTYETILETVGTWTATNATSGASITITSITATDLPDGRRVLVFVFTTSGGWVLGENVRLCIDTYADLITAGIEGYEPGTRCIVLPN